VADTAGAWTIVPTIRAVRSVVNGTDYIEAAGYYTMAIQGDSTDTTVTPGGDSIAWVAVDGNGYVSVAGWTADSTPLTAGTAITLDTAMTQDTAIVQETAISAANEFPLYASLYNGKGAVFGWVKFDVSDVVAPTYDSMLVTITPTNKVQWQKAAGAAGSYTANGFSVVKPVLGSPFQPWLGWDGLDDLTVVPNVYLKGPEFASVNITMESGDAVSSIPVSVVGAGYLTDPTVTIDGGTYTVKATAHAVRTGNTVTSFVIDNGGYYSVPPTGVTITSASGSGAIAGTIVMSGPRFQYSSSERFLYDSIDTSILTGGGYALSVTNSPADSYVTGGFRQLIGGTGNTYTFCGIYLQALNEVRGFYYRSGSAQSGQLFLGRKFDTTSSTTAIVVNSTNLTVAYPGTRQFSATAHYSDGSTKDITHEAKWDASGAGAVAVIDANGLATGVAAGTSTITASLRGQTSAGVALKVTRPIQFITVTAASVPVTVMSGSTLKFTAIATYDDDTTADITTLATWISGTPAVASIIGGTATGVTRGSTSITATYEDVTSDGIVLTVNSQITALVVSAPSPGTLSGAPGATIQFTAMARYSDGTTSDVTKLAVWTSSSVVTATISNGATGGIATKVAAGTTVITANIPDGVGGFVTPATYTLTVL